MPPKPPTPRLKPGKIALIAHDNLKSRMVEWARHHQAKLRQYSLCATGTTGGRIGKEVGLEVECFKSGPMGGDQQIGAQVAEGKIGLVIFFWDPLSPHSHDVDIKALLRIAAVYDVPMACSPSSADLILEII